MFSLIRLYLRTTRRQRACAWVIARDIAQLPIRMQRQSDGVEVMVNPNARTFACFDDAKVRAAVEQRAIGYRVSRTGIYFIAADDIPLLPGERQIATVQRNGRVDVSNE